VGAQLLGAETLQDLALALFVGMAVGTYSSVVVATPFLVWLKEKEPRWAELKERVESRRGSSTREAAMGTAPAAATAGPAPAPAAPAAPAVKKTPPRKSSKSRAKRRR
jgi:preprotein translocase subunit SecF